MIPAMRGFCAGAKITLIAAAFAGIVGLNAGGCGGTGDTTGDIAGIVDSASNGNGGSNNNPGSGATDSNGDSAVSGDSGFVSDELVVQVKPGSSASAVDALYANVGATVQDRLSDLAADLIQVNPNDRDNIADELGSSPLIESVGENQIIGGLEAAPEDQALTAPWHLTTIGVEEAWKITRGDPSIVVAVLDTGVDTDHPSLTARLLSGGSTVATEPGWEDKHGHGTGVSGIIIVAADRLSGVDAVAPNVRVKPIRVADVTGKATSWALAAGINLAVQEGAKVINISIAPLHHDTLVLRQAEVARLRGSLVIFAAGNEGDLISGGGSDAALFVGATNKFDERHSGSSYGAFLSLVAPGVAIQTTKLGGGYAAWTGTSFAAPIVSGVAGLVWSVNPNFRPATVEGILTTTAVDLGPAGADIEYGVGRIDAKAAVELAEGIVEQADTTPPAVTFTKPAPQSKLAGTASVEVSVTDSGDVVDVTLLLDGVEVASDLLPPYSFALDTTKFSAGQHTLAAKATDFAGNVGNASVAVLFPSATDASPPTVEIRSPLSGAGVSGVTTILAAVTDDVAIARVEIAVDGGLINTLNPGGAEAQIAYNWDTSGVAAGLHTLTVTVFDEAGKSTAASVSVTRN